MSADGKLVEDFLLEEADEVLHVLNAPSPGATASLAIGRMLAEKAQLLSGSKSGRDWDRTSDLPRVKRALSR
jgi:L-2-hydroxyglutarate oxidase LhgO